MTRPVLYLTHSDVGNGYHLWALRLAYVPGILGVVVGHGDDQEPGLYLERWDWDVAPMGMTA